MGQPHPPHGKQAPYTERPRKVYAEQYIASDPPPYPVGVQFNPMVNGQPLFADGQARVALDTGWVVVNDTDWIVSNSFSGLPVAVMSAEEFEARYTDETIGLSPA